MKKTILLLLAFVALSAKSQYQDSVNIRKIYDYYLTEGKAYKNLEVLCKTIGGRLSGSPQAAKSVEWAKEAMYAAGADTVYLQPCMVTHWERGAKEMCVVTYPGKRLNLNVCALGGSNSTPVSGLTACVVEVRSWE